MAITGRTPVITLFSDDDAPTLEFTINKTDGSGALDLSSASSAKCYLRKMGGTANVFSGSDVNGSVEGSLTGRVDYSLPSGGVSDAGVYFGQVEITWDGGTVQKMQRFQVEVEEGLA